MTTTGMDVMNALTSDEPDCPLDGEGDPGDSRTDGIKAKKYSTDNGVYWGSPDTVSTLPPGFYKLDHCHPHGYVFINVRTKTDKLLALPDPTCEILLREFVKFWEMAPGLLDRGLMTKRGILLWGPPGSGKTSAVNLMAAHMIKEMNGVVFLVEDPNDASAGLQLFRKLEPRRPAILIYEDLDSLIERYNEPGYLSLLDGESQVDGVVSVATTNYPEKLDKRITARPGRFDRITRCPMPNSEMRREYIRCKAPEISESTQAHWVSVSDGWSLGHIRELIIANLALGEEASSVINRLNEMNDVTPRSDAGGSMGFAA